MKKRMSLGKLRETIRRLVESELDDELNTIEIGDVVDVDHDGLGTLPVRVIEFVDDVRAATGYIENDPKHMPNSHMDMVFRGPGFVGEIDPSSGESGRLVFSMNQVMPGSKMKGYFPKLGDENDEDEYGRPTVNPYRQGAKRHAVASRSRKGDYLPEGDLDESEEDHVRDPRWDNHADPTGKAWDPGL